VTKHVTNHMNKHMTTASHVTPEYSVIEARHVINSVASTVEVDDGSRIPSTYKEFVDIFSKTKVETLPPHRTTDHATDLEPNTKLPYGRIYSLSEESLY